MKVDSPNLRNTLDAIRDRLQVALDGTGSRPWSHEYVLQIVEEVRDLAIEALLDDEED